jgi:flavodoxin
MTPVEVTMNVLIVYDTKFGNTERIARSIARGFGPSSHVRVEAASETQGIDPGVDLMIVGGPTQAHGASQPMRAFLERLPDLPGTRVSAFDTRYDKPRWLTGAASGVIADMLRKHGATLVRPGESFFITAGEGPLAPGEEDRAAIWGATLAGRA